MTVKYIITNLDRVIEDGTVVAIHWRAFMQENQYAASTSGVTTLSRETKSPDFIPFEDLTEEVVVNWVKQNVDTESIEANLLAQIAQQKTPKETSGLPWSATILGDPISVE